MSSLAGSNSPSSSASEGDRSMLKGGKEDTWGEKNESSGNKEIRGDLNQTGAQSGFSTARILSGFDLSVQPNW